MSTSITVLILIIVIYLFIFLNKIVVRNKTITAGKEKTLQNRGSAEKSLICEKHHHYYLIGVILIWVYYVGCFRLSNQVSLVDLKMQHWLHAGHKTRERWLLSVLHLKVA